MAVTSSKFAKNSEKIPISKAKSSVQSKPQKSIATMNVTVSPTTTTEDEVIALRAENKVLRQALNAVEDTATEQLKKSFELVWFARNRCRYPNHEASKRIEGAEEHKDAISDLRGQDADYHHGFNSGLLAASRLFKEHADISHLDLHEGGWHEKIAHHTEKVGGSKESFPRLDVDEFPGDEEYM
eukprot:CAMPEP_0185799688 /NCGR_PEP_ID=MMETSP1322-20130828/465_1 /TAXON_ID=265543 /ORGANISM="Minutocellus polymorphus, Strain RCC2270" /LENGTH=183 /DNA_ID=CAMNT_0028495275 /DNA_START=105 /DNA_END=656 /DNA_ORIENTATION=-